MKFLIICFVIFVFFKIQRLIWKKRFRIVKRTFNNSVTYTIQERHYLFNWWWVDAWMNHDVWTTDTFNTLEEAKEQLKYFNTSIVEEEVVEE